MLTLKCPACSGDGWIIENDHHPDCDRSSGGDQCEKLCPVAVQERCLNCGGTGEVQGDAP